jgi:thiopurine S-methyltransferase
VYENEGLCIYCGDFFDLVAGDLTGVGAVYDRASLIALPPDMRAAYARHMAALLQPGTRTLLVGFDYPQHEMQGPPFSVQADEIQTLFGKHGRVQLLHSLDILAQEPRFQARGVTRLQEQVYALTRHSSGA